MPSSFTELAQYNRWANVRLYEAALDLLLFQRGSSAPDLRTLAAKV